MDQKRSCYTFCLAVCVLLVSVIAASPVFAQVAETFESDLEWQGFLVGGWFTGGSLADTTVAGEAVGVDTDDGWFTGVRFGAEAEYLGFEITTAGIFSDMDLNDPFGASGETASDAQMFLASINAMIFPTGNEMAEGRVRPFVTIGPGLVYLNSDFDPVDEEVIMEINAGFGIKFLFGDDANTIFRIEWRWHQMFGSSADLKSNIYRQEVGAGLGIRF